MRKRKVETERRALEKAGATPRAICTLAIDVGGSHLKAAVVDETGHLITAPVRVDTPVGSQPDAIVGTLVRLVRPLGAYDRVSIGFPGVVRAGRILSAPNLGNDAWKGFDLDTALTKALGKPVRIATDADVQGLGVIAGEGLEMIITLGTGVGTGLYLVTNFDRLYIGGGNAKRLDFEPAPDITLVSNRAGIESGAALW